MNWVNIFTPLAEMCGLQVRMNVKRKCVELRVCVLFQHHRTSRMNCTSLQTSKHTKEVGALQQGADFVKALSLGFDVNVHFHKFFPLIVKFILVSQDALALLRMDDLYLDSFELKLFTVPSRARHQPHRMS
jgi:RNA-binding protein PNO1